MRCSTLAALAAAAVVMLPVSAAAITIDFTSSLDGASERPDPADSTATGTATGQLNGDPGLWVFTYHIEYDGLTGPATLGHIHDAVNPGGLPFVDMFGPPVHDLDSLTSPIDGDWTYLDAGQPLTDELADKLIAGQLYINIHTDSFPNGEIRGQLLAVDGQPPPPPPPPGVIPLPAPAVAGLIGLALMGGATRARRFFA
jgi:hypothetical protein